MGCDDVKVIVVVRYIQAADQAERKKCKKRGFVGYPDSAIMKGYIVLLWLEIQS